MTNESCNECGWGDGIHYFNCPQRKPHEEYHIYNKLEKESQLSNPKGSTAQSQ